MIRQLEMPWQSRALVLLDPDASNHPDAETFEHAVRGAASVMHHLFASGFSPTLWTGRVDTTTVGSMETYGMAMEELALVQASATTDLQSAVGKMRRRGMAGGALVLVTGRVGDGHLALYRSLGRDYTRTVLLAVSAERNEAVERFRHAGAVTVLSPKGTRWTSAWQEAMERSWSSATQR